MRKKRGKFFNEFSKMDNVYFNWHTEKTGPRTLRGPKTQDPMRSQDPMKTQDSMRTQDPRGFRNLWGPRNLRGPRNLWGLKILWWPRKDPGTYKLAKVFWFPYHVFNLVEFTIKGRFIYHCWKQNAFFVKLKICWK